MNRSVYCNVTPICCENCGTAMTIPDEEMYEVDGDWLCEECFKDFIDAMTMSEIADKMGIQHKRVEFLTDI